MKPLRLADPSESPFAARLLVSTPMLLKSLHAHKIAPTRRITHRFKFDQILAAYDAFGNVADCGALKVIIEA